MPRPRRQARDRRPDLAALTRELFYHLTVGWCHFRDAGCRGLEELVEAWAVHGPAILPRWIRHHPGTRPFGWWAAVGVPRHGERRLLSAAEVKAWCAGHDWPWDDCYGDNADAVAEVRQGRLHPGHFGILHTEQWPPMQESEVDYLDRHGLLGRAEVRALDEAAAAGPDLDAPYAHPGAAVWDELQPLAGNGRGTRPLAVSGGVLRSPVTIGGHLMAEPAKPKPNDKPIQPGSPRPPWTEGQRGVTKPNPRK